MRQHVQTVFGKRLSGQGKQLATLLEANWLIARGNNLKITDEFLNPNRAVPNGEQTRWSLVYEFTPIRRASDAALSVTALDPGAPIGVIH